MVVENINSNINRRDGRLRSPRSPRELFDARLYWIRRSAVLPFFPLSLFFFLLSSPEFPFLLVKKCPIQTWGPEGGGAWTPKRPLAIYGTSGWDVPKRIIFFFFVFFCKSFRKSPRWLLSWFYYRKCPRHSVRVFFLGGGRGRFSFRIFIFIPSIHWIIKWSAQEWAKKGKKIQMMKRALTE